MCAGQLQGSSKHSLRAREEIEPAHPHLQACLQETSLHLTLAREGPYVQVVEAGQARRPQLGNTWQVPWEGRGWSLSLPERPHLTLLPIPPPPLPQSSAPTTRTTSPIRVPLGLPTPPPPTNLPWLGCLLSPHLFLPLGAVNIKTGLKTNSAC